MATDESYWINRAQSAEAKLQTVEDQFKPAIDRVKEFKANFGVREKSDGTLVVDYDRFAQAIGVEGALELRGIIDEKYSISGEPGAKPRIKLAATA